MPYTSLLIKGVRVISIIVGIILACRFRVLGILECLFMIATYETNRYLVSSRQSRAYSSADEKLKDHVACCIGYQENASTFGKCLRGYKEAAPNCKALIVALDGSREENSDMAGELDRQFPMAKHSSIEFDKPLGQLCEEAFNDVLKDGVRGASSDGEAHQRAFQHVYRQAEFKLRPAVTALMGDSGTPALLLSQPHAGMKAVRFTAWLSSIIVADVLSCDYMWSSDSDSFVTPGCIDATVAALSGDSSVGGASAGLAVRDRNHSWLNRLYGGFYQSGIYLLRSCASASGKATCVTGPSACYRIVAIRQVLAEWYLQRVRGKKMWVNEDVHMTRLLGREGWSTLYVPNAMVLSEAPPTWEAWFKQQIRWERASHLGRWASASNTFDPGHGVVPLAVNVRDILMMPCIVASVVSLALYGPRDTSLLQRFGIQLLLAHVVEYAYNILRSPEPEIDIIGCIAASLLCQLILPFDFVWSLLTLFEDSWESSTKRLTRPVKEYAFCTAWCCTVLVALTRYYSEGPFIPFRHEI